MSGARSVVMGLWVAFAVLTGVAVLTVLMPLTRPRSERRDGTESDIAVYKDQLREIEADLARGVIDAGEAEAARTEVGRRLLAADRAGRVTAPSRPVPRALVAAVIVLLPAASLGLYLAFGSPNLPGQPLSARLQESPQEQNVDMLVARVEDHLAAEPEDGRGWEVLAPVYMRIGRYDDSAQAWANAIRLLGSTPEREANRGEALVAARDGLISDEARQAFARALRLDAAMPKARYFVAMSAEQDGDTGKATQLWRLLLADSPPDAPWRPAVEQRLAALAESGAEPAAPGPSREEVAAASEMSEAERAEMISGMVDRLAGRLAENGADLDGWLRLARAYVVLGDEAKARQALASARENFPDDETAEKRIDATAVMLGLERS